jgi:hypothetical protein
MKFRSPGTFETETLIDIAQRTVAALQDAGVERVAGVNLYLTIVDKRGLPCPLCRDGEVLDWIDLDVSDLALEAPSPRLSVGKPETGRAQPSRRTPSQRRRRS